MNTQQIHPYELKNRATGRTTKRIVSLFYKVMAYQSSDMNRGGKQIFIVSDTYSNSTEIMKKLLDMFNVLGIHCNRNNESNKSEIKLFSGKILFKAISYEHYESLRITKHDEIFFDHYLGSHIYNIN